MALSQKINLTLYDNCKYYEPFAPQAMHLGSS